MRSRLRECGRVARGRRRLVLRDRQGGNSELGGTTRRHATFLLRSD